MKSVRAHGWTVYRILCIRILSGVEWTGVVVLLVIEKWEEGGGEGEGEGYGDGENEIWWWWC